MTLICPFNFIKSKMLLDKLKGHNMTYYMYFIKLGSYDAQIMRHNPLKGM